MERSNDNWVNKSVVYILCPNCNIGELNDRIAQSFIYKYLIFWRQFKRYTCHYCNRRIHVMQDKIK
jgi:hypothetical protein